MRGVWVVRTTLTDEGAVREMVARTHEAGFNTLLVQVRGRGDAYYRSQVEPRSSFLEEAEGGFDPLETLLEEAHRRGMQVHAWVVAQLVWGLAPLPPDPAHLVNRHPDWLSVPRPLAEELWGVDPADPAYAIALHRWAEENRVRVEGVFADPGHPGARQRLVSVVRDLLVRYHLDGIHLDYLRYPSPEFDYSRGSLERFREFASAQIPVGLAASLDARVRQGDVTVWARENPGLWDAFRESRVTSLVRAVRRVVDDVAPDALLSVAVFADPVDAERGRFQDWRGWLASGTVDAVAPMAYTPDDARFSDLIRLATEADEGQGGRRVWAGVGVYQTSLEGAVRKVRLARASGAGGVVFFSYDWAREQSPTADGEPYLESLARRAFGPSPGQAEAGR
ncbi:MAG: family 10 glycosylhydrolase [Gemmatimonadota bacterium]